MSGDAEESSDVTEELAQAQQARSADRIEFYGGKWMSGLPIALFIVWAIVQSGILRISDTTGLVAGMLLSLIAGMLFVRGDWKTYANTVFDGMTQRVAATAIVAWLWAGMFSETIQVGGFVSGLVWAADVLNVGSALFPAVTFVLAALLATGIGTGYGTTVAFSTLIFPAGVLLGANPTLLFGAILSGAAFGDNLAPVSDTTIVSAVTQESDIGGVVASRFKYAIVAAVLAFIAYLVAGQFMGGQEIAQSAQDLFVQNSEPIGLVHLLSMFVVITTAIMGRHIIEAISLGLIVAMILNVVLGLASISDMVVFKVSNQFALGQSLSGLPMVELVAPADTGVGGSIYSGAEGFFPLAMLVLLIVAGSRIMIRGGAFEALQEWLLTRVATTVRRAEVVMVIGTGLVNAMITINTAAEITIAPYIARIGERFNINGYRRANILDANTTAMGYIFPWAGGVLVGYAAIQNLPGQFDWFTQSMVVNPAKVVPYVFHGWLLFAVFLVAAVTGFGLEYVTDRESTEVTRV
ncbi:Na+/H+ antiporter NhaC family protein [Halocatena halophila]|uniref:Na+/H+ antiporter NhaC family protein n=1 Tax=Halocatena halophila TaxID=2814576 RepID=UPI002ED240B7